MVVRSNPDSGVLFTTCSATNAPVTTTDGLNQIATFKASTNLNIIDSGSPGFNEIDYLVIAGGGSGAGNLGGGGAGGYRTSYPGGIKMKIQPGPHAVTIGAGGARTTPGSPDCGVSGNPSSVGTIFSTGGGGGIRAYGPATAIANANGGSGGGAKQDNVGGPASGAGLGNTPPVSPPQGNNGGTSDTSGPTYLAGGGGGAGAVGGNPSTCGSTTGPGGAGVTSHITGSPVGRAGGGGAGDSSPSTGSRNAGTATDGGGTGQPGPGTDPVACGAANKGGGGGGGMGNSPTPSSSSGGGTGGSGVVILRYKFQ